jgi:hypothetical protein
MSKLHGNPPNRPAAENLAELMGAIAHRCIGEPRENRWPPQSEYILWEIVHGRHPVDWGRSIVSGAEIMRMQDCSDACRGWVVYSEKTGPSWVPDDVWGSPVFTRPAHVKFQQGDFIEVFDPERQVWWQNLKVLRTEAIVSPDTGEVKWFGDVVERDSNGTIVISGRVWEDMPWRRRGG